MPSYQAIISTPIGLLGIIMEGDVLCRIDFVADGTALVTGDNSSINQVVLQLQRYFKQADEPFSLSLQPVGTLFQCSVWRELQQIPVGEVRTYGEIAAVLGTGSRAVGNACRNNPLPVVVPCHRVVAVSGPGGYAGQTQGRNMRIKGWLLAHEGVAI